MKVAATWLAATAALASTPSDVEAFVASSKTLRVGQPARLVASRSVSAATSSLPLSMAGEAPWKAFTTDVAKKVAVAATVAAVAFSTPGEALAARSGGRMGGRSFSSPSRSYSAPSAPSRSYAPSYGGGGTTVLPVPVPMGGYGMGYGFGSPFGFSPFGRPGVSFYGGGFGVNPVDLLVLGGVAYGVSQLVKGGGTSFGNLDDSPPSSLGEGVDVLKLQVAINCRDRGSNSILGVLEDVSSRGDTESRSGLAEVVSEVSLALARRSLDWVASASELEHFNNRNVERAEATFSQYSIQLRTKVERETNAVIGGKNISAERSGGGRIGSGGPTVAVVSLVVALRGDAMKKLGLDRSVSSTSGLKTALQTIASGALSDGGDNVLAAEVLWTPEEPWEVLTREDAIADFPELMDL
ncbi:unnamed protein product [Ectocarpus sp. 12 AP-2014]